MKIKIVSDSACDLPDQYVEKYDIDIVPFSVTYGGDEYFKDDGSVPDDEFYNTLLNNECSPKTSLPSVDDYLTRFEKYAGEGLDILCFCISSRLSGSYNSASLAANIIKENHKDIKIEVIDSLGVSMLQGFLVVQAAKLLEKGFDLQAIVDKTEKTKQKSILILTVDSLVYLQRGGRIGKASSLAGGLLNIKPIIKFDNGELLPHSKVRTKRKTLEKMVEIIIELSASCDKSRTKFFVLRTATMDDANDLKQLFTEKSGIKIDYEPFCAGCTIAAHTGPTLTGICFFEEDVDAV